MRESSFNLSKILDLCACERTGDRTVRTAGEWLRLGKSGETAASTTASHYALIWPG